MQLSHGDPHGHRKFEKMESRISSSSYPSPDHYRPDVGLHSPHHSPRIYPVHMYPLYTGQNGPREEPVENNLKEKRRNFSTSRDSMGSHHNRLNEAEEAPSKGKGNLSIMSRMSIIIVGLLVILCCVVSFAALILSIRQHATITSLKTTTETLRSALAQTEDRPNLCLPCADLSLGPFPEDTPELAELLKHEEKGEQICCAKTSLQTSVFLNLVGCVFTFNQLIY